MNLKNKKVLYLANHTFKIDKEGNKFFEGGTEVMSDYILRYLFKYTKNITFVSVTGNLIPEYFTEYYPIKFDIIESLDDILKTKKFDFIVISTYFWETHWMDKLVSLEIPILHFMHGFNCCFVNLLSLKYLNNPLLTIITPSKHEYEYFESKCKTIYLDYPTDYTPEPLRDVTLSSGLLSISRQCSQKGIPNAARLSKLLNTKLIQIGTRTSESFVLKMKIRQIGCNCIYLNSLSRGEVKEYIKNSAFLVHLPDSVEGSPLVIRESMMLGTPVITWNDFSLDTIVHPDYCIILNHDRNYLNEFKQKYLPVIDKYLDKDNRNKLMEYANNRFSINTFYENLDNIIMEV